MVCNYNAFVDQIPGHVTKCKVWIYPLAEVAQLVEQLIRNQQVGSSNLLLGSSIFRDLQDSGQGIK